MVGYKSQFIVADRLHSRKASDVLHRCQQIVYALFVYYFRSKNLERKQVRCRCCFTSCQAVERVRGVDRTLLGLRPASEPDCTASRSTGKHLLVLCVLNPLNDAPNACLLQYGFFDDKLGPVTLCVLIMLSLTAIMVRLLLLVRSAYEDGKLSVLLPNSAAQLPHVGCAARA